MAGAEAESWPFSKKKSTKTAGLCGCFWLPWINCRETDDGLAWFIIKFSKDRKSQALKRLLSLIIRELNTLEIRPKFNCKGVSLKRDIFAA